MFVPIITVAALVGLIHQLSSGGGDPGEGTKNVTCEYCKSPINIFPNNICGYRTKEKRKNEKFRIGYSPDNTETGAIMDYIKKRLSATAGKPGEINYCEFTIEPFFNGGR